VPSVVGDILLTQRAPSFLEVSWTPPGGDLSHYRLDMFEFDDDVMHSINVHK